MNNKSGFHLYSVGIVAKDIVEDEIEIEVFPIESQTHIDGDIDKTVKTKVLSKDIHGKSRSIVLTRRVTIVASWIPLGDSNRSTAPMVKKGEQVRIYRYANTDDYYWSTIYNEFDLRRNEKVKRVYSNTSKFKEELTDDNTYWEEVDTINKKWRIHVSDNDGELCTWDIRLDAKEGILKTIDGRGNVLEHNAKKDLLYAKFNKEINLNAPKIVMNSDEHIVKTKKYTLNSTDATFNATNTVFKSTNTTLSTNVAITGDKLTHNGKNIGGNHGHPESIGTRTGGPS